MISTKAAASRKISKTKFSMYLRTNCDRELYFSLFSHNEASLQEAGLPLPLKSRTGVQLITAAGNEFEHEQYDILLRSLPSLVISKKAGRDEIALAQALPQVKERALILQPAFEPEEFREFALGSLGVSKEHRDVIPPMSGLRPDVLLVDSRTPEDFEVLPDGSRRLVADADRRQPLCIVDLKNVTEANASYSAEVCLYAVLLSSWLATQGAEFQDRFFVSSRIYLWRHVEMPVFTDIMRKAASGAEDARFRALLTDLEDGRVNYLVYMPSVRKFFAEDLPRVILTGDNLGWQAVDYHVNPRCGSCDWLGNRSWLTDKDRKAFDANPDHYCYVGAENSDHLSKMPTLSKGAARILEGGGHPKVADLVDIEATAPVLRTHALLKKDRTQVGQRAKSIVSNDVSVDLSRKVGGLAKSPGAEFCIVVNFDSGSGLLTGLSLRGTLFSPFGKSFKVGGEDKGIFSLGEDAFVVIKDNSLSEWSALAAFIEKLAAWIEKAEGIFKDQGLGTLGTQIYLWERRQYEELCDAFGRHLLRILELTDRQQRALAWIFPPEELLEKLDEVCPNIVFVRDIVSDAVRIPQRFSVTLLGAAEYYHHERLPPREIDTYYVEPLGNAIPRERIFEIWKSITGTVKMFGRDVSILDAAERYKTVLKAHSWAMSSILARLRTDLKGCLSSKAPELSMSIPSGLRGVAYDSKLWDRWATISAAVQKTEGLARCIARPEALEASYEAIVLGSMRKDLGGYRYEFEVSPDSTEAKIEEDDQCTIGIVGRPGFPLQKASDLGLDVDSYVPMHGVIALKIERFDRAAGTIEFTLESTWAGTEEAFDAAMRSVILPIEKTPLYILPRMPYSGAKETTALLAAIGDPACAAAAPEALRTMGVSAAKRLPKGKGNDSPIARILWDASAVAKAVVRTEKAAANLVQFASSANEHPLNDSQRNAVTVCASQQIAIVWGPPGTGKTETLVAFLHAVIREGRSRKILVAGPNYRTVEELSGRLLNNLNLDSDANADMIWMYSKSREPKDIESTNPRITAISTKMQGEGLQFCKESLSDGSRTTIVSTTSHNIQRLIKSTNPTGAAFDREDGLIEPVFDLVVLDESSQIPVTLALQPLSLLKADAQLIVAGDSKQMPPIQGLDAPMGAEHLVGSIQSYLTRRFSISEQPLLVNYRSNEDLVAFARSLGYPRELKSFSQKKDLLQLEPFEKVLDALPALLPRTPAYVELLDPTRRATALIHDDAVSSQANELEAGLVAGLAFIARHSFSITLDTGGEVDAIPFTDNSFFETGIGIVTPHKAQKALVVRKLAELFPDADPATLYASVDTVERFQGGERNLIIVSYGVGDTDIIEGEEEFLLQLERTNVAISRAKAKCIVVMPKTLAYHLPSDKRAADTSVALKSYLEEFCDNRISTNIEHGGVMRAADVKWH